MVGPINSPRPADILFAVTQRLWGIDLGGTKIEGVIANVNDGDVEVAFRHRIPTEADQGYRHIIGRIRHLLDEMTAQTGERPAAIGIGTPGTNDPATQLMRGCNTTALNGQPLVSDLQAELGVPVRIANDANCFALAEALLGAGKGARVVFGVIMGTGVGGGVVVDGKVLDGRQGIAGEWGHNLLDPDGPDCYCGRRGCVETILSGPFLERYYTALAGEKKRLADIVSAWRAGTDAHAVATIEHLFASFGKAIGPIVNVLDPDMIVLGGGVGNISELLTRGAEAALPWIFNPNPSIQLAQPLLGDSAGVFGAALLTEGMIPPEFVLK